MNHRLSREELMDWINAISLALYDSVLFLDTHPCDENALVYFKECSKLRDEAMKEYAKHFGPLTIGAVNDSDTDRWNWIDEPWPWQEGGC